MKAPDWKLEHLRRLPKETLVKRLLAAEAIVDELRAGPPSSQGRERLKAAVETWHEQVTASNDAMSESASRAVERRAQEKLSARRDPGTADTLPSFGAVGSPMMCEHPNENPRFCMCANACYCRRTGGTCDGKK